MKIPPYNDDFVNRYDPNSYRNYACVEYTAMGAAWLHALGKHPVFSVAMANYFFLTIIGIKDLSMKKTYLKLLRRWLGMIIKNYIL